MCIFHLYKLMLERSILPLWGLLLLFLESMIFFSLALSTARPPNSWCTASPPSLPSHCGSLDPPMRKSLALRPRAGPPSGMPSHSAASLPSEVLPVFPSQRGLGLFCPEPCAAVAVTDLSSPSQGARLRALRSISWPLYFLGGLGKAPWLRSVRKSARNNEFLNQTLLGKPGKFQGLLDPRKF